MVTPRTHGCDRQKYITQLGSETLPTSLCRRRCRLRRDAATGQHPSGRYSTHPETDCIRIFSIFSRCGSPLYAGCGTTSFAVDDPRRRRVWRRRDTRSGRSWPGLSCGGAPWALRARVEGPSSNGLRRPGTDGPDDSAGMQQQPQAVVLEPLQAVAAVLDAFHAEVDPFANGGPPPRGSDPTGCGRAAGGSALPFAGP